jgi:enoyl-[acyl-carrier protein] reductase I
MPNLLQNKTALVTGVANRWSIAYAVASAFRREGAQLVLTYQGERQRLTVEELGHDLGAAKIFNCDVTKPEELDRLAAELKALPPGLDIAVHSIAFANKEDLSNPFVQTSRDGFLLAQEVSAYSLVSLARTLAPLMASGGAILTLTYLGSTRVNAISAGPIKTASARAVKDLGKMLEAVAAHAPLRRNTEPAEVADTAVFLASDMGRGITGSTIFVDGGYHIMGM